MDENVLRLATFSADFPYQTLSISLLNSLTIWNIWVGMTSFCVHLYKHIKKESIRSY